MSRLAPARVRALRDEIHAASFSPQASPTTRVGVEIELIAHDIETDRPVPLHDGPAALVPRIRSIAHRLGWAEYAAYDGTTRFDVPGRALISFEPGGQIEISSVPCASVTEVVGATQAVVDSLRAPLEDGGIALRSVGIDPYNEARDIPLQLPVERYQRMTDYFERVGPFGIRMMRQTAAIQVSIDRGSDPAARWRLLNDLAPYLVAIFANSRMYARRDSGHQSFRAHCWRRLDATRTGVAEESGDPADAYTRFALAARDMMRIDADGEYRAFEHWLADDQKDRSDRGDARWMSHLTTLFPEVRPRGHFEVRSCDAVPLPWVAVPIVFVTALAYEPRAATAAAMLAAESRALLRAAGEHGLQDAGIARTSRDLFQLALAGAERLGPQYVSPPLLETARQFYDGYTARGRSLADDAAASVASVLARSPIRSPI